MTSTSCGGRTLVAIGALAWAAIACAPQTPAVAGPKPRGRAAALAAVEQQLIAAAVDSIAAAWPDSTALCLGILGGPAGPELPTDGLLEALRTRQRPVSVAACPRTYASMIAQVDSLGRVVDLRPPGYVDPYVLTVGRPQFASDSYGWIHARELRGTVGRAYLCTVQYVRGRAWAHCETLSRWIH